MAMLKHLMSAFTKRAATVDSPLVTSPGSVDLTDHAPVARCSICSNLVEARVLKAHTAACASYSAYCFGYDGGEKCTSCGVAFTTRHDADAHLELVAA